MASIVLATVFLVTACTVEPGRSPAPRCRRRRTRTRSRGEPVAPTYRDAYAAADADREPHPNRHALTNPSSGEPTPLAEVPGTPHVDPELEAYLPTLMSKTPLIRTSMGGSIFGGGSDMCILICGDEPYRYAKELGVGIEDITIAFAVSDSLGLGMIAYRARGAKTDRLIKARIAIGGYTGYGGLYDLPVTVNGRPATYLDAGMATNGEYLMTRHDVLFIVLGEAPSQGQMPSRNPASPRRLDRGSLRPTSSKRWVGCPEPDLTLPRRTATISP